MQRDSASDMIRNEVAKRERRSTDYATGSELLGVSSLELPDYKDNFLDITLSSNPDGILLHKVRYAMLVAFCSAGHIEQYLARRSDGSKILIPPASKCVPQGIQVAIRWMTIAYNCQSHCILPRQFLDDLLAVCYAERAFSVLKLRREARRIRLAMVHIFCTHNITVDFLKSIWETLPQRCYWVNKVLDHIWCYLENRFHARKQNRTQMVCNVCGVSMLEDSSAHKTPKSLIGWVMTDKRLQEAVRQHKRRRDPSLYVDIAARDSSTKVTIIETWILNVEDKQPLPFGMFPRPRDLIGDVMERVPAYSSGCKSHHIYTLEWSDFNGGCFIETYTNRHPPRSTARETQTTVMSLEWLASRAHRSRSCTSHPHPSILHGVRGGADSRDHQSDDIRDSGTDPPVNGHSEQPNQYVRNGDDVIRFRFPPDNRFFDPMANLHMAQCKEPASQRLTDRLRRREPFSDPNALPRDLWNKPSLIDFDHWAKVNDTLRRQGVRLPCDYMFAGSASASSPIDSDETSVKGTSSRGARVSVEEQDASLGVIGQEVEVVQRQGSSIVQVFLGFGRTAWAVIGKCLLRNE
ncbi:Nn.00g075830.m01.CDS01 [Neocucurbitaria sp. VM-36]